MATRSANMWVHNRYWTEYQWCIFNGTLTTDGAEWLATVAIPDPNYPYSCEVDGELKPIVNVYFVGAASDVPSQQITSSYNANYVSGKTGQESWYNTFPSSIGDYADGDYRVFFGGFGGEKGAWDAVDYEFNSWADFEQAMDDHLIEEQTPKVYFDVYINGSDKPSLFVNWTAPESMSPVICSPKVWLGCQSLILDNDLVDVEGLRVPNVINWNVESAGSQSYAGSYKTSYLSIMEVFEKYLNPANKVVYWGFNGELEFVRLYLRMDYEDKIGDLFRVAIGMDGSLDSNYKVPNSSLNAPYDTVVRIHYGEPDYILPEDDPDYPGGKDIDDDGPGRYDPDNPPPVEDFEDHEGNGFDGNAVLTKTYAVTAATLQNIGQKLWTQSYFNVLKVQSNPIENIVSVKGLPMEFTGTAEEIKVGDIAFGINGDKVASVQKITIGSIKYMGKYGNYLDFAPYTKTKLNLPYIGLIELDPADLFNSTLNIDYVIDLVTGQCMAILTLDGIPFMNVTGQMGFDIPITATDRVQTELRVASAAITAIGGAAGHMIGGDIFGAGIGGASSALSLMGADYTSQRTASPSPACASFANHLVYLLVDRPLYEGESAGYKHLHGYPCHKYMNLGSLSGFVAVDARTDINIAMTSEENAMLEQLLTQGIYI